MEGIDNTVCPRIQGRRFIIVETNERSAMSGTRERSKRLMMVGTNKRFTMVKLKTNKRFPMV
jgi:hypothetical protein